MRGGRQAARKRGDAAPVAAIAAAPHQTRPKRPSTYSQAAQQQESLKNCVCFEEGEAEQWGGSEKWLPGSS